jgi:hypothetical protein
MMGSMLADAQAGSFFTFAMLAGGMVLIVWGFISSKTGEINIGDNIENTWESGPAFERKEDPLQFMYLIGCLYFFGAVLIVTGFIRALFG